MCISADYGTVCKPIKFIFGKLMCRHVFYILLIFQINILNGPRVINIFIFHYLGEQLAVQTCHVLQRRGGGSPRLSLPVCEGK